MPSDNSESRKPDSRDVTFRSVEAHLQNIGDQVSQVRNDLTRACTSTDDALEIRDAVIRDLTDKITRVEVDAKTRLTKLEVEVDALKAAPLDSLRDRRPPIDPVQLAKWLAIAAVAAAAIYCTARAPASIPALLRLFKP